MRYEKWADFQLLTCFSAFLDFHKNINCGKKGKKGKKDLAEILKLYESTIFVVLSRKPFSKLLAKNHDFKNFFLDCLNHALADVLEDLAIQNIDIWKTLF